MHPGPQQRVLWAGLAVRITYSTAALLQGWQLLPCW